MFDTVTCSAAVLPAVLFLGHSISWCRRVEGIMQQSRLVQFLCFSDALNTERLIFRVPVMCLGMPLRCIRTWPSPLGCFLPQLDLATSVAGVAELNVSWLPSYGGV